MSLKAFHVFFILVSMLLSLGFGLWAVGAYLDSGAGLILGLGLASFVGCVVLAVYGKWFLKKLSGWSYL